MDPGTIAAVGGPVAGAVGQYFGTQQTNAANANQAYLANLQSAQNMKWSAHFNRNLANRAMRRHVNDLKKAGINPLLGLSGGGAGSNAATTGGAHQSTMQNPLEGLAGAASSAGQLFLQSKKQKEEIGLLQAQRGLTEAQKNNTNMDTTVKSKDLPKAELLNSFWQKIKNAGKNSAKELNEFLYKPDPRLEKLRQRRKP